MSVFDSYINDILNERGINSKDKEELKFEILDHLMLLKEEFIANGYKENEAINLAIKEFGNTNSIGNDIKEFLPSHNKLIDLSNLDKLKCLFLMFLTYTIFICFSATVVSKHSDSLFFNYGLSIVTVLTSFLYINQKVNVLKNKVNNILICNLLFFISEKILMSIFILFSSAIEGIRNESVYNLIKTSYLFNFEYIISYIILTICSIVVTRYILNKLFTSTKNNYNHSIISLILFSISIILTIMYYLIPNRFYLFRKAIILIIGTDINIFNKNIFYMVINNSFIVPNIGLILIFILLIRLISHMRKKGVKSIF